MLNIKGIMKSSFVDYPSKIVHTLFFGGCNFRCGFCHNPSLVFDEGEVLSEEEIFKELEKRKNLIDGICITGGEPLLADANEFIAFINKVKEIVRADGPFLVKLDTNGTLPGNLEKVLPHVDYVAMDIKSSPQKYSYAAGVHVNMEAIKKSISLIMNSGIDYEFRTTVVPGVVEEADFLFIGDLIMGADKYALQQFLTKNTLDPSFSKLKVYPKEFFEKAKEQLKDYIKTIEIR